ncbi:glycosyltransferase family 25 protein [Profundibacterium mesophilum]|uniref:Collagen beta-1O-galactosyltransferase n=1 Tax=Profundibacterium mesophilum KAUST100406-0324 TaxID=1037889 RepID=A0A921NQL1_9RHOB|nr:glycosyltransferase family 25 protein [Profundibacterium mesophilum]KAF0676492.1 collagen beta-1O-galactosyltransferase [Profundibacterium mesophilum KAUST100406-0324]
MGHSHGAGQWIAATFEHVRIISLPSRKDRRRDMTRQLARIGLVPGEGNVAFFDAVRCEEKGGWPTIGARGCFLSHLGVLQEARDAGARSVLIIEDDANFGPALLTATPESLRALGAEPWDIFYGGQQDTDLRAQQPVARVLDPETRIVGAHFIAMRDAAIPEAAAYLEALASRAPGDPAGGPMHVDGAYSRLRRSGSSLKSAVCVPDLAYQRSSRTDIHELSLLDRLSGLSGGMNLLRGLQNWLRDRSVGTKPSASARRPGGKIDRNDA